VKAQRIFLILIIVLVVFSVGWFMLVYQPLQLEIKAKHRQLTQLSQKIHNAQNANINLKNVEKRAENAQKELEEIRQKFVNRDDLSRVTKQLQQLAIRYNVEITDFSPVLDSYFDDSGNESIKPLPIVLTVIGRYLEIGRFIENMKSLNFYLTPQEFLIEKIDPENNDLEATITCNLYTWK